MNEIIKNQDCVQNGCDMSDEMLLAGFEDYEQGRVVDAKTALREIAEKYGIQL